MFNDSHQTIFEDLSLDIDRILKLLNLSRDTQQNQLKQIQRQYVSRDSCII